MRNAWIVCGVALLICSCGQDPPAAKSNVVTVTEATFEQAVLKSKEPVVVDFWATWCLPCRELAPVVDELSIAYAGKVKFVKVDIDDAPQAAKIADVPPIPALVLYQGGVEVDRKVGLPAFNPKGVLTRWLDRALATKPEAESK